MQRGRLGLLVILLCPSLVDAAGLGPWTLQTSMNVPRSCHALAAVGDRIYAIGGGDNSNITPAFFSVEFADVDAS